MNRIEQLNQTVYDLIVMGGGSVGAGIARDAARRGLKVLLAEKGDFGSGTSSRTSKIVHGGIRYLEQGEFGLVFESLRERFILQKIAPHLVRPLPFLIPVYKDGPRPFWMIGAGLKLYDALCLYRNKQRYRMIDKDETLSIVPGLKSELLVGAGLYYDSQMNDARLVLENVLDAKTSGATVLNYVQAGPFRYDGKKISGVQLIDRLEGGTAEVTGRAFVNAGGPWITEIAKSGGDTMPPRIRMTQGTHLVVPQASKDFAIVVSPKDEKRIFFIIPWHGNSLIGTTDLDFRGDPMEVHPQQGEIEYLIRETRNLFPGWGLKKEDIISVFCGVRPLLDDHESDPSSVTRRTKIVEGASGLISIAGGKFTTYRSTAEKVVDLVGRRLARTDLNGCDTAVEPLYGGKFKKSFEVYLEQNVQKWAGYFRLDHSVVSHLICQYGNRAKEILDMVEKDRSLADPISPILPDIKAEIKYAVENEMALTLSDFMRRRTLLALAGVNSEEALLQVSSLMGRYLSWDAIRIAREIEIFRRENLFSCGI